MSVPEKIADSANLAEAIRLACEMFPELNAQKFKDDSKEPGDYTHSRTFRALCEKTRQLGKGIVELGIPAGSLISILSENQPEWNICDFAILYNACATVGVYTNDSVEHIEFKMNDTQSAMIFVEDVKQLKKVLQIPARNIPSVKHIVVFRTAGVDLKSDARLMALDALIEKGAVSGTAVAEELDRRISTLTMSTLARLVYTSGTSGNPKGAMLTHGNLLSNAVGATDSVNMQPEDVLISFLPEAHVLQTILTLCTLLNGGCLGYSFRKTLVGDLPQLRPTLFPGVQRVWAKIHLNIEKKISSGLPKFLSKVAPKLLANMIKKKAGIEKVRYFVSGAGKLEPYTYDFFKNVLGITIFLGYGLSETSPVISVNNERFERKGSSGKPIPGVQVRIVDETRKEVPVGKVGEIACKGPNVFIGYYNQEAKFKQVVDSEGWFYTGDRGYVDSDGFVFVLGRAGYRVKFSDGEHHDLEEIGSRILGFTRYIQQIAVYGEGKDYPVAIISLTDEEDDLRSMASSLGVKYTNRNEFAYNEKVVELCKQEFEQARKDVKDNYKVGTVEDIAKAIYIRPMSEDNGEKTPTQKTRLNLILDKYLPQIEELYKSEKSFVVLKVD